MSLPQVLEAWHNEQEHVPLTEDSSHRLAVCNMDWDRIEAKDIFGWLKYMIEVMQDRLSEVTSPILM